MEAPGLTLSSISKKFTQEILELVVQRALKGRDDLSIRDYKLNFGTEKGDGYIGIIYLIRVQLSDGSSLSLIGKGLPPNLVRRKTLDCEGYFAKEVAFYNEFGPLLSEFEIKLRGQEKSVSDTFLPIPQCYYAMSDGVNDFLVMQDLKVICYKMASRQTGPSEAEQRALLRTLARFHGLSLALQVVDPNAFAPLKKITEPWFYPGNSNRLAGYMHKMYMLWYRAIKEGLNDTECLKKFEAFGSDPNVLFKNLCGSVRPLEPCVVAHGDAWSTNFLFRGKQVMMIDFQMARYCSTMSDLAVYIFACTTEEQRQAAGGMDAILKYYYKILSETLKELGVDENPLTWEKLLEQWRVNGLYGFGAALELVPMSLVESEDVQDLDRLEGEEPVDLVLLTQFNEITDPEGKKRLEDLTKLAFDYGMI